MKPKKRQTRRNVSVSAATYLQLEEVSLRLLGHRNLSMTVDLLTSFAGEQLGVKKMPTSKAAGEVDGRREGARARKEGRSLDLVPPQHFTF